LIGKFIAPNEENTPEANAKFGDKTVLGQSARRCILLQVNCWKCKGRSPSNGLLFSFARKGRDANGIKGRILLGL